MTTAAAIGVCVVLAGLTVFQVLLVFGAPIGRFAWGGRSRVLPTALRIGSAVAVVIYAVIAAVVLRRADLVDGGFSQDVARTGTWIAAGYFLLGIAVNAASRSRPERMVMTPVAAVLCVLCFVVASG